LGRLPNHTDFFRVQMLDCLSPGEGIFDMWRFFGGKTSQAFDIAGQMLDRRVGHLKDTLKPQSHGNMARNPKAHTPGFCDVAIKFRGTQVRVELEKVVPQCFLLRKLLRGNRNRSGIDSRTQKFPCSYSSPERQVLCRTYFE
jgi:hypothetical protein